MHHLVVPIKISPRRNFQLRLVLGGQRCLARIALLLVKISGAQNIFCDDLIQVENYLAVHGG